jgi:hexosaminidase
MPTYFDYRQADDEREPLAIGGPLTLPDVAAFAPAAAAAAWPDHAARRLIGTQFQLWTEYIPDGRAVEYMAFPRACVLAEVAWSGGPAAADWRGRLESHLGRLDAAGIGYRPLDGPRPWQEGGAGARRHRAGYRVADIATRLAEITRRPGAT